jgi:glycosyltransferase involved in cell wall biosynthesis
MEKVNPFLTIYTPTYKRPKALEVCKQSIEAQTYDEQIEWILIADTVGIGIPGVYADVVNHVDKVHGDYVLFLSDDDYISDAKFVQKLHDFVKNNDNPAVVVYSIEKSGRILPTWMNSEPQLGHIDLSNFVVRSDVWKEHADKWGRRYEGDYDFIRALWDMRYRFTWMHGDVCIKAQRISRGLPE